MVQIITYLKTGQINKTEKPEMGLNSPQYHPY